LVTQFELLNFTKEVSKNQMSPNQKVQKILFQMLLLNLNLFLFAYLKEYAD